MIFSPLSREKPGQTQPLARILAVALAIVPIYSFAIWSHLTKDQPYTITEMMLYPLLFGGGTICLILFLQRFLCRESLLSLNRRSGRWWTDGLSGLGLFFALVVLSFFLQSFLARWFANEPAPEVVTLLQDLSRQPWLMVLWLGPVLWLGVAAFEELSRVFFLHHLWIAWPQPLGRWIVLLSSATLFGLAHLYQGPAGMISNLVIGLVYGWVYLIRGRIWPLIVAHGLYDAFWIVLGIVLLKQGLF